MSLLFRPVYFFRKTCMKLPPYFNPKTDIDHFDCNFSCSFNLTYISSSYSVLGYCNEIVELHPFINYSL